MVEYGNLGLALIIYFKWLGWLNIKGVLFIRRVQIHLLKSVLCLVSKPVFSSQTQTRCLKAKKLTVFCHELVFSSTPSLTDFDTLVFLSPNSASENIVPELGISSKRLEVSSVGAVKPDSPVPCWRASPAEPRPRLLTPTPLCLSRLSSRLGLNKWQQLIKHMLSITYSRALARWHLHAQPRTVDSLQPAFPSTVWETHRFWCTSTWLSRASQISSHCKNVLTPYVLILSRATAKCQRAAFFFFYYYYC